MVLYTQILNKPNHYSMENYTNVYKELYSEFGIHVPQTIYFTYIFYVLSKSDDVYCVDIRGFHVVKEGGEIDEELYQKSGLRMMTLDLREEQYTRFSSLLNPSKEKEEVPEKEEK